MVSVEEIGSHDVSEQLPGALRQWLVLERFYLHKLDFFQSTSSGSDFDLRWLPQHAGAFQLPCFRVDSRNMYTFGRQQRVLPWAAQTSRADEGWVLFPVHPSALNHYQDFLRATRARNIADEGLCIWALPTSSTRTLLAWPDGQPGAASFVKTSLHSQIFGDRRILRSTAGRSVGMSSMVANERADLPSALCYLPESFAFCARQAPHTGALIREIPSEILDGRRRLIPLFALLGGSGAHIPLLRTILERSNDPPLQFVHDVLCEPFARLWVELSLKFGWILESHGQDLLLEFGPDLSFSGRFYYRDFEGLQADWELRRRFNRPPPEHLPNSWSWRDSYDSWGDYPFASSLWFKWRISLSQYLDLVLHETEASLRDWQREGLIGGPPCREDEVTMLFSQSMFAALERTLGMPVGPVFDIRRSLNRFLILLGRLRRRLLDSVQSPAAAC